MYNKKYMFYLTLNERAINKGVCDFNDCDYRLINRLNKKDKTKSQPQLVRKYINHISNHYYKT